MKRSYTTFTSKGQVVIPSVVRETLAIYAGTRAAVTVTEEGILLKPITRGYLHSLRGTIKQETWDGFLADRKEERNRER